MQATIYNNLGSEVHLIIRQVYILFKSVLSPNLNDRATIRLASENCICSRYLCKNSPDAVQGKYRVEWVLVDGGHQELPLKGFDEECRRLALEQYRKGGVNVHTSCSPTKLEKCSDGNLRLHVEPSQGDPFTIDNVSLTCLATCTLSLARGTPEAYKG